MYSIEVNIQGFTTMNQASFEDVVLERYRDDGSDRIRDRLTGSVLFWGDSYEQLKNEKQGGALQLDGNIIIDSDIIYSGKLQLRGIWHEKSEKCYLEFEIEDEYTEILRNFDEKIDKHFCCLQPNITMDVKVENRHMFQAREADDFNPNPPPLEGNLWAFCNDLTWGEVGAWDVNREYIKYLVEIKEEGGTLDAYQSLMEDITITFCHVYDLANLRTHYYAAKTVNKGKIPALGISTSEWKYLFSSQHILIGHRPSEMGQNMAIMKFHPDAEYSESLKRWRYKGCIGFDEIADVNGNNIYKLLGGLLGSFAPGINIDFDTFLPYVDTINPELKNLIYYYDTNDLAEYRPDTTYSLKDVISVYESLFNVKWAIENGYLVFRHASEIPAIPGDYESQPYQHINKIFAKDWSNEIFTNDVKNKIVRETFTLGVSEEPYFGPQVMAYDNNYIEKIDINFMIETDISITFNTHESSIPVVVQYGDNDKVPVSLHIKYGWIYNWQIACYQTVFNFYRYMRPFNKCWFYPLYDKSAEIDLTLYTGFIHENEIQIPYTRQDLINFDYLIVTSYGNLKVNELSVSLNSASASIKASRQ